MKSKGLIVSKFFPLHITLLSNIKHFLYEIAIQFNNNHLVVAQNNYTTKIVKAYVICDLDNWPNIPPNNFKFKDCFFGVTNVVKNSDKEKWVYSGLGITFDSANLCSFGNDDTRNIVIFGVDNSLLSQADDHKSNF